jgi:hypothetical protein
MTYDAMRNWTLRDASTCSSSGRKEEKEQWIAG